MLDTLAMADADEQTLFDYYTNLMVPAFQPDELMTWPELRQALQGGLTNGVLVLEGSRPVAGLILEEYVGGKLCLLAYLVVAPHKRGQEVGSTLIKIAVADRDCLVLAEIEDPRFYPEDPNLGNPIDRVRFYDRLGSRLLPVPHVQPSLRPGSPRVGNLLLITIPSAAPEFGKLDGELVVAFLDEYFIACEGDAVLVDRNYQALRSAADQPVLQLASLSDLNAARPTP